MFGGEYRHTLDDKGRVSVPFRFREEMGGHIVVSKGLSEKCLYIFTWAQWEKLSEKIADAKISDKRARNVSRRFFGSSVELDIDKQGRIMLPQFLLEYAGLVKDTVIVGAVNRVEIWSADEWQKILLEDENEEEGSSLENDMMELGI